MNRIGFHVSISDSISKSVDRAQTLECNTFQIFTRNPRSWITKPLDSVDVREFRRKIRLSGIRPVFSHMPYLANLSSPNDRIWEKSVNSLIEEVKRSDSLGIPFIVTHLGSHMGLGSDYALKQIILALEKGLSNGKAKILLENSSGSGNHFGNTLEELKLIMDELNDKRLGICFDTCHAFASGYNISSHEGLNETIKIIRNVIGFTRLKLIHLNDSRGSLGSKIDHHEHIGLGFIGEIGFREILKSDLAKQPMIMETPIDERSSDIDNMRKVKALLNTRITS